jgi:hypothetical protein
MIILQMFSKPARDLNRIYTVKDTKYGIKNKVALFEQLCLYVQWAAAVPLIGTKLERTKMQLTLRVKTRSYYIRII